MVENGPSGALTGGVRGEYIIWQFISISSLDNNELFTNIAGVQSALDAAQTVGGQKAPPPRPPPPPPRSIRTFQNNLDVSNENSYFKFLNFDYNTSYFSF